MVSQHGAGVRVDAGDDWLGRRDVHEIDRRALQADMRMTGEARLRGWAWRASPGLGVLAGLLVGPHVVPRERGGAGMSVAGLAFFPDPPGTSAFDVMALLSDGSCSALLAGDGCSDCDTGGPGRDSCGSPPGAGSCSVYCMEGLYACCKAP